MPKCGHCGYELDVPTPSCPLCGGPIARTTHGVEGGKLIAWEDPVTSFPVNLFASWRSVLLAPAQFFRGVPFDNPLARPILFFLIATLIFAVLWLAASVGLEFLFGPSADWAELSDIFAEAGLEVMPDPHLFTLLSFFSIPFMALLALLWNTLVIHLLALLLAPERGPIGATLRVLCYASAPMFLAAVPIMGGFVAVVWGAVLAVFGVRVAHNTSTGRAIAIVITGPLLLALVFFTLFLLLVWMAWGVLESVPARGLTGT